MKKNVLIVLFVAVAVAFASCCVIGVLLWRGATSPISITIESGNDRSKPEGFINQPIEVGPDIITVHSAGKVEASHIQASTGNVYYYVDVTIQNNSYFTPMTIYSLNFRLIDVDGYNYNASSSIIKEPGLNFSKVPAGGEIRGFVVFEIPDNAVPIDFTYLPSNYGNYATIHLQQ